jgi:hypothetical protein
MAIVAGALVVAGATGTGIASAYQSTGAPIAPATAATASEAPSSENAPSDGPGGHADAPGNVDHQADGSE